MISIALRALLLQEEEEAHSRQEARVLRRKVRDAANPLDLTDNVFVKHFRVNKDAFICLLNILKTKLSAGKTCRSVLPITKLSACLRFFAEGSYQTALGNDHQIGLAQSSFSEILSEVLNALQNELCKQYIQMPRPAEKHKISIKIFEKHCIQGVIGCVDGSHIAIIAPSENKQKYLNRKGFYSMNVMFICDHQLKIRYVDAVHPGSYDDSFIWNQSSAKNHMEEAYNNGENYHLLADSEYPLQPWLLTPFSMPTRTKRERDYNKAHVKCKNMIERTISMLKNRWKCLLGIRVLHYTPSKAIQIINVCCALHNICLKFKVDWENNQEAEDLINKEDILQVNEEADHLLQIAKTTRLNIADSLSQPINKKKKL